MADPPDEDGDDEDPEASRSGGFAGDTPRVPSEATTSPDDASADAADGPDDDANANADDDGREDDEADVVDGEDKSAYVGNRSAGRHPGAARAGAGADSGGEAPDGDDGGGGDAGDGDDGDGEDGDGGDGEDGDDGDGEDGDDGDGEDGDGGDGEDGDGGDGEDGDGSDAGDGDDGDGEDGDGGDGEDEATADTGETTEGRLVDTGITHAPDDEEQPLEAHVTEMIHRFLAVAVAMAGVAAVALLWSDDLINFLWYSFLGPGQPVCPGQECPKIFRPHLYHPLSLVLARLKIAVLVGFVVGLPVAVYQTYLFMRPGLYPRERRYYLAAVPTSLVLAGIGVAFAYFLILPALFSYFMGYSTRAAEAALGLAETFNIMVILLGFFALIFQIPLFVMLAIMMGVTTRRWLEGRRLYFWMGFGGVAFIFSPDPTGMAPLLVALTMIGLFEGTLGLLRWTGKDSPILAPGPMRARRPYAWVLAALAGYAVSGAPLPTGYYGQLPSAVRQFLADLGWTALTPLLVAVAIVAAFELLSYGLRRLGAGLQAQLWLLRVRWPVWIGAAVVGYLASPNPGLLEAARTTELEPPLVAAVVLGTVVLYEVAVQLVVWRREE